MAYKVENKSNRDQLFKSHLGSFYVKAKSSSDDVAYAFTEQQMAALKAKGITVSGSLSEPKEDEAVSTPEENALRADLKELGVEVDGRWGIDRLKQELEKATQGNSQ